MKNPIIGYIVIGRDGEPLEFCAHPEHLHKILLRADVATAFSTREEAQAAIQATQEWAKMHRGDFGDKWVNSHRYSVWPVRKANINQDR